jgi:hypothetical protein
VTAAAFTASINRLLAQVSHWQQPRWSSAPAPTTPPATTTPPQSASPADLATRADVIHELVQRLADLAADAEHHEHRQVPREHDLVLPDQLRVMSADLLTAAPSDDLLARAASAVEATRRALA